jgi:hypothetical protein
LIPGTVVTPGVVTSGASLVADSGATAFNFGADQGTVEELVVNNFGGNPFGAGDLTFAYQITVTAGHIDNLTTGSFNIPGISIDVAQDALGIFGNPTTQAVSASLTSDGTTLGFGFTQPDGLKPGDTSFTLLVNTNLTNFQPGVFSLQDDQTGNFNGFVPAATPEPSTLSLLGTGLLAAGAGLRRKMRRA